nr:hemolysin XhlA family protein [Enterococcus mundtii]
MWVEVLQRLARIEENTKHLDTVTENARQALSIAKENEKAIREIKESQRRAWRTIAGMLSSVGASLIVYLVTKFLGG